jgi:DNA-binding FrmR family transcriptional regulator
LPAPAQDTATRASHRDVANRLERANGHVQTIVTMIESGRGGIDIAQQMQAMIRALEKARTVLIDDHIDHCLERAVGPAERA